MGTKLGLRVESDDDDDDDDKGTQVVGRIKSSGSPCPLDKISIICFKRCPYLRKFLTEIIQSSGAQKGH